ncbi:DUF2326 domain-containing protein [Guptibacillus spartinae]|uniref:DUF2326 domain-containing protein n=1 Tax=Guptibacillus spartinae TaxID=3025679 RepID=UPI0023629913|nr:DUF2326 domain-containing protein [Pseudalkalibacillus spartinae]
MLVRIKSAIFAEDKIEFHQGLNVVLGDNKGSNSIGKSTLLMMIDFIYGGNTYQNHNSDVITHLGHHDFGFTFKFDNYEYHFVRGTENPDIVYKSNEKYEKLYKMKVNDYTNKLKRYYDLASDQITFRTAVSTYSRVWGKENYNVNKPLHSFHKQVFSQSVTNLIKLFNKYNAIELQDKELKDLEDKKQVLNKAGKYKLIPKITKKEFDKNLKEIKSLNKEIERLGKSAYSTSGDIKEIVSDEMIDLREKKKKLIEEREYYISRLNRTTRTIKKSADAGFESLMEFFPDVDLEKLQNIESFHEGISSILSNELEDARKELSNKIDELEKEINAVIKQQDHLLNPDEELTVFIDTLIEYSSKVKNLKLENEYYNKLTNVREDASTKKGELEELKEKIVEELNKAINTKLKEINDFIHEDKRAAPEINLTYNKYDFKVFDNTGTGKAYTNLIIFDLAILSLTDLPFIMHDSFLFKNIEKDAVEKIIKFYSSMSKQVFIAIDIIDMYNQETQDILQRNKVIQLSEDNLLTKLDWRDSK